MIIAKEIQKRKKLVCAGAHRRCLEHMVRDTEGKNGSPSTHNGIANVLGQDNTVACLVVFAN